MAHTRIGKMITRETGLALAVLALWMVSLLAPLHQTSGVLRDLAMAGHDISGAWSICVTLAEAETSTDHLVQVCPAHSMAKLDLAAPPPKTALRAFVPMARAAAVLPEDQPAWRPQHHTPGRPRAPPAQA